MKTLVNVDIDHSKREISLRKVRSIPSIIKWTGSKRSQVNKIVELVPPFKRYIEPFVGGGALLYALGKPDSIAGDIYRPLVELWQLIQHSPSLVIEDYQSQWQLLNDELNALDMNNLPTNKLLPIYFYKVRERFNREKNPLDLNFIMRTCVNGIVRFNDKGEFNNSFHLSRRGMEPARFAKAVLAWQNSIQGVYFVCQDYSATIAQAEVGDFVYFDPPYAGNKQRYTTDLNLDKFFSELEKLNSRGVKWALSFDGGRGSKNLVHEIPKSLYKQHKFLVSGNSAVNNVLNGSVESVKESLYLNY